MKRRFTMAAVLLAVIASMLLLSACGCRHESTYMRRRKDATCQEAGYTGDICCWDCTEVVEQGTEIPIIDHVLNEDESYEASCTKDGLIAQLTCIHCGLELRARQTVPAIGHHIKDPVGAYEPTCIQNGFEGEGICLNCYENIVGEEIPRLPHNFVDNVCTECGWLVPGLYDDDMNLVMTWKEIKDANLVGYKRYSDQVNWISDQLHGLLVVEEGLEVNLRVGDYTNNGIPMDNLTGIYTSYTQTAFAEEAFRGMNGVEQIKIFGKVETIPYYMFGDCRGLEKVILPDTVKTLEMNAFERCSVEYIALPEGLKKIGNGCFSYSSLKEITLPASVSSIGDYAFMKCSSLEKAVIPHADGIGTSAFSDCDSLTDVTIGSGVNLISNGMFKSCDLLTEITISEGVKKVLHESFDYTPLKELVLPSTLTYLGSLSHAEHLERIDLSACTELTFFDIDISTNTLSELILPPNMTKLDLMHINSLNLLRLEFPEGLNELRGNFTPWNPISKYFNTEEIVWPVSLKDGTLLSELPSLKSILYRGSEAQWNETVSKDLFPNAVITFDYSGN